MIVDIHAHYFAKEYIDLLMRIGGRSVPEAARALTAGSSGATTSRIATRCSRWTSRGADAGALPGREPAVRREGSRRGRGGAAHQRHYAELAQKHPRRFTAVVSLPLPHIDASLREMERGLDQLGMLGVSMTAPASIARRAEASSSRSTRR
jgi:aminocarboxymuconate-semialdehyde decarboxylase